MSFSIGILIIGSLYWDSKEVRRRWRTQRLDLGATKHVFAPIRYGRCSQTRGDSYTMVFSADCGEPERLGRALAVPCLRPVRSINDLVEEAECLWAAERNSDLSNGRISANWGCVTMVVNPADAVGPNILDAWALRVRKENRYGQLSRATTEREIVMRSGIMDIAWPAQLNGQPLELDAVLATATDPTIIQGHYPTAQDIADRWRTPIGSPFAEYFWRNREHNITTFQDDDIESRLKADDK